MVKLSYKVCTIISYYHNLLQKINILDTEVVMKHTVFGRGKCFVLNLCKWRVAEMLDRPASSGSSTPPALPPTDPASPTPLSASCYRLPKGP